MNYYEKAIKRLGWQEVTLWYLVQNGIYFNHIEIGHNKNSKPISHKSWKNQCWSSRFVYAIKGSKPLQFVD